MTDDDRLTLGEIRRAIARLESEDRSLAMRLTSLAAEMVPAKLWESEHRALIDKLILHERGAEADRIRLEKAVEDLEKQIERVHDDHEKQIERLRDAREKRSEVTWQKITGLILALAAIAGVIVALMGQSKGIH